MKKSGGYLTGGYGKERIEKFIAEAGRTGGAQVRAQLEKLRNQAMGLGQRLQDVWARRAKLEQSIRGGAGQAKAALKTIREIHALKRQAFQLERQICPVLAKWDFAQYFAGWTPLEVMKALPDAPPPLELKFKVATKVHGSMEETRYFYCEPSKLEITGRVTDAASNPIAGAEVQVLGRDVSAKTGIDGRYQLVIKGKGKRQLRDPDVDFQLAGFALSLGAVKKSFPSVSARTLSDKDGKFRLATGKLAAGGKPFTADGLELRLSWAGPEMVIEFITPHKPWTVGGKKLSPWVFLQAEDFEFEVRVLFKGEPVKKPQVVLTFMSPRAGAGSVSRYRQRKLTLTWSDDERTMTWKGILPAHASPGAWAANVDAKVVAPDGKEHRTKKVQTFEVREDHRMTAEKLEENFQWVLNEWRKGCEAGLVRRMFPGGIVDNYDFHGVNMARSLGRLVLPGYPKGKLGPVNNLLAMYHNPPGIEWVARKICGPAAKGDRSFFRYTCAGYAARALNCLNAWRYSTDYATRRRLLGVDYTPVYHWPTSTYRNAWLNHIAVLIYKSGYKNVRQPTALNYGNLRTAHRVRPDDSAVVLEPWLNQSPKIMKASVWMKTFTDGTGMGLPEDGGDWASYCRIPGLLFRTDYTHKKILDTKTDKDDAGGALIGNLTSIPRTRMLTLSPVNLIITDEKGRKAGVTAAGKVVGSIPGVCVEFWPDGKHMSQHVSLPHGKYKVQVVGKTDGKFGVAVLDSRRDPLIWGKKNVISKDGVATLDLTGKEAKPQLILPGGKKIAPEVVPLRKNALALKTKLDKLGFPTSKPKPVAPPEGTVWHAPSKSGFWIAKPKGWKGGKPDGDLVAQFFEENKNAFVEVYTGKIGAEKLKTLGDAWEKAIQKKMPTVFAKRISSATFKLGCDTPALQRDYEGSTSGVKITAKLVFAVKKQRVLVIMGISVKSRKDLGVLVQKSLRSLRTKAP